MYSLFACRHNSPIYTLKLHAIRQGVRKQIEFDVLSVCHSFFLTLSLLHFNFGPSRRYFASARHFFPHCHLAPTFAPCNVYCFVSRKTLQYCNIVRLWIIGNAVNNIIFAVCLSIDTAFLYLIEQAQHQMADTTPFCFLLIISNTCRDFVKVNYTVYIKYI